MRDDHEDVLLHILSDVIADHWRHNYYSHGHNPPKTVEIEAEELELKVFYVDVSGKGADFVGKRIWYP